MKMKNLLALILVLVFSAASFGGSKQVSPAVQEAEKTEAAAAGGTIETNFLSLVYNEP